MMAWAEEVEDSTVVSSRQILTNEVRQIGLKASAASSDGLILRSLCATDQKARVSGGNETRKRFTESKVSTYGDVR